MYSLGCIINASSNWSTYLPGWPQFIQLVDHCLLQRPKVLSLASLITHMSSITADYYKYIYIHTYTNNIIHGECQLQSFIIFAIYQWPVTLHIIFLQTNVNMYNMSENSPKEFKFMYVNYVIFTAFLAVLLL